MSHVTPPVELNEIIQYVSTQEGVINVELGHKPSRINDDRPVQMQFLHHSLYGKVSVRVPPVPRAVAFFIRFLFLLRLGDYVDGQ
jgi:hypothetical protein